MQSFHYFVDETKKFIKASAFIAIFARRNKEKINIYAQNVNLFLHAKDKKNEKNENQKENEIFSA